MRVLHIFFHTSRFFTSSTIHNHFVADIMHQCNKAIKISSIQNILAVTQEVPIQHCFLLLKNHPFYRRTWYRWNPIKFLPRDFIGFHRYQVSTLKHHRCLCDDSSPTKSDDQGRPNHASLMFCLASSETFWKKWWSTSVDEQLNWRFPWLGNHCSSASSLVAKRITTIHLFSFGGVGIGFCRNVMSNRHGYG